MKTSPTAHERFIKLWRIGYAKDYSKGRRVVRESAKAIHFPAKGGKWVRLFWRFYFQTTKKGYNDK